MPDEERIEDLLSNLYDRGEEEAAKFKEEQSKDPAMADELHRHLKAIEALDQVLPKSQALPKQAPKMVGGHRILREIGRGGMGIVYEAEQLTMGRKVALKILAPVFTESTLAIERFKREAKAAGQLHHTHIAQAFHLGQHEGYWYYTMALVEGASLSQKIEEFRKNRKKKPSGGTQRAHYLKVAEMLAGVADALDAAHEAGIIHRDIKPGNLLLDGKGTLKIVDFGMARLDEAPSMTLSGEVLGTPIYMSPEQARAKLSDLDHRTDIYSLGATLYEVLTLRPPFQGKSALAIRSQIITRDPPPPRQVDRRIPKDLSVICTKAMQKDRKDRYPTAKEMARDLNRFVEGMPIHARPIGLIGSTWRKVKRNKVRSALMASILLLAMAGGFLGYRAHQEAKERRDYQYKELLFQSQQAIGDSWNFANSDGGGLLSRSDQAGRRSLSEAIELCPDRMEAYWLRALLSGRKITQRLADVDEAEARGFSPRTADLLRGYIRAYGKKANAEEIKEILEKTISDPYADAVDDFAIAQLFSKTGNSEMALEHLGRAIEKSKPTDAVKYLSLKHRSSIFSTSEALTEALTDLIRIETNWDSLAVKVHIASLKRRMGKIEEAEETFEKVLKNTELSPSASKWWALCQSCLEAGEYTWLDRAARTALKVQGDDPPHLEQKAAAYAYLGEACSRLDNLKEARKALNAAFALSPLDGNTLERLGVLFQNVLGESDKALQCFDDILAKNKEHAMAWANRGVVLSISGNQKEAIESLERALELGNSDAWFYLEYGRALGKSKRFEDALESFDKSIALNKDVPHPHYAKGVSLTELGKIPEALKAFKDALAIDPEHYDALNNRASLYLNYSRDLSKALEGFKEGLRHYPEDALLHLNKGITHRLMEQYEKAHQAFTDAIGFEKGLAQAYSQRSFTGIKLWKIEQALNDAKTAIRLDGSDACAHFNKGSILSNTGDPKNAAQAFAKAVELEPEHAMYHFELGKTYLITGQYTEALESFNRALQIDPASADILERRFHALKMLGKYQEALETTETLFEEAQKRNMLCEVCATRYTVQCLRGLGDMKEALLEAASRVKTTGPEHDHSDAYAYLCAVAGEWERAEEALAVVKSPSGMFDLYERARVHAVLGNIDRASELIQSAIDKGLRLPPEFSTHPDFAGLQDDERIKAFLK